MLSPSQKLAIYMPNALGTSHGKMGDGVMRYAANPITCVIDAAHAGRRVCEASDVPADYPVLASVAEAAAHGAEVLVLGVTPSGGQLPEEWHAAIAEALQLGLCIVNGMHDDLNARYEGRLRDGQWIWDVRRPGFTPRIAAGRAATLPNKRVLFVGSDMAIGKMTAALEIHRWLRANDGDAVFLATGQIGITIAGRGIPLDAFKVDHACGAVEAMVLAAAAHDVVLIEGQGSLLHPGSSATLPLMRGSCATHLIMCHRAGMQTLHTPAADAAPIRIPPLREVIRLNEEMAFACGALTRAVTVGVALNTVHLNDADAAAAIAELEDEVGLPAADVVRGDAGKLGRVLTCPR